MAKQTTRAIPTRTNLVLSIAISAAILAQLLLLPLVGASVWVMLAIVLVLIPINTPYWSLIHEAIHNNLNPDRSTNRFMGRSMSVLFGAGFGVLRFGHLMHHQYNRDWESEYYDEEKQSRFVFAIGHYFKMLGGLYLTEVIASFALCLLPNKLLQKAAPYLFEDIRHGEAFNTALLKPESINTMRFDCLAIVALYGLSFYLYGDNWIIPTILILGRAVIVSLMDNAYHYDTPPDNSVVAHELSLPRPIEKFILSFNHHRTHHNNVALPWSELKDAHHKEDRGYSLGLFEAIIAQFRGPIKKT